MKLSKYLQPVMEMPELAPFPDQVRRIVIFRSRSRGLSFPVSGRDCMLGILRGILSGLTFVMICLGVFVALMICFTCFGAIGFASAFLGCLGAIGSAATVSRVAALRGIRKQVRWYLQSDEGRELSGIFGS
jgi:hypothetical protein